MATTRHTEQPNPLDALVVLFLSFPSQARWHVYLHPELVDDGLLEAVAVHDAALAETLRADRLKAALA